MKRSATVWVRNNGKAPLRTRYDGEEIVIDPDGIVEMEVDCARLCLGLGDENKGRVIARLGWAPTPDDFPAALERINSFSFHETFDEARQPIRLPAPADNETPPETSRSGGGVVKKGQQNLMGKVAAVVQHTAG